MRWITGFTASFHQNGSKSGDGIRFSTVLSLGDIGGFECI